MIYENKFINRKKGVVAIFPIIVFVLLGLLAIYLALHLPIPAFAKIRSLINYLMVIIFWVLLQIGIIYGYYRLGLLAKKGFNLYKNKVQRWTINVKNFLLTRT